MPDQSIYQCMYLFIYAVWNNLRDLDGQVINYAESITNFKKAFNTAYELFEPTINAQIDYFLK